MQTLEELQGETEGIVRRAGEIARHYFAKITDEQITLKSDQTPVTVADLAINDYLLLEFGKLTPDISIMSEESSSEEKERQTVWVIDPIDGTKNFMAGNPYFGISVGLVYEGVPEIGIVYAPVDDKLYSARRGAGTFLNGSVLTSTARTTLSGATVLIDKGTGDTVQELHRRIREALHVAGAVTGNYRSASRELCSVAEGTADCIIHSALNPWDVAGGMVIAQEAGLSLFDLSGNDKDLFTADIVASAPEVRSELSALIKQAVGR